MTFERNTHGAPIGAVRDRSFETALEFNDFDDLNNGLPIRNARIS
jgi:hypothetical protein